jgi:hypothetical protein
MSRLPDVNEAINQALEVAPREIRLNNGMVALVDAADFNTLSQFKWQARGRGNYVHASRSINSDLRAPNKRHRRTEQMHRVIMGVTDPRVFVDHRDGDRLNNQRSNLRVCSNQQNQGNQGKPSPGRTSQFKGVSLNKESGKWRAQIKSYGRAIHLGLFADEVEAARAYDLAAIAHFGEFARLNFPEAGVGGTVEGHGTWRPVVGTCALELSGNGMETLNPYPEQNATARSAKPTSECQASPADSRICSVLDHFTNRITRYVDKKLGRETELAEVGQ